MYEQNTEKTATIRKSDGLRKAAIFLVAVGEEAASEILRGLTRKEVEKITKEISRLRNVPSGLIKDVITEYYKMWQAKDYVSEGGITYAEQVLKKALGDEETKRMLQKIGYLDEQKEISNAFDLLEDIHEEQLVNFLQKEHPQTIAIILSRIDPSKAATIMEQLPEELQIDIANRIATLDQVSPDFVAEVEEFLESHFTEQYSNKPQTGVEGKKLIADVLNMVGKNTEKKVIKGLGEIDQNLANEIKNLMFVFDDLVLVDDRSIQKILKEIDTKMLSVAMKGVNEEVKEKIFSNMSSRAAEMLKEEIEYLGPVKVKEVEEAQRNILSIVSELDEKGEIVIYREGGENEIIT